MIYQAPVILTYCGILLLLPTEIGVLILVGLSGEVEACNSEWHHEMNVYSGISRYNDIQVYSNNRLISSAVGTASVS